MKSDEAEYRSTYVCVLSNHMYVDDIIFVVISRVYRDIYVYIVLFNDNNKKTSVSKRCNMKVLLVLSVLVFFANAAKILVVFPVPAGSHYILGNALTRILVEAGHDVTFISPKVEKNPPKNGTWTDIVVTINMFKGREGKYI